MDVEIHTLPFMLISWNLVQRYKYDSVVVCRVVIVVAARGWVVAVQIILVKYTTVILTAVVTKLLWYN